MQRAERLIEHDRRFRSPGLVKGAFYVNVNECVEFWICYFYLGEVGLDEFDGRDFFLADFFGESGSRRKYEIWWSHEKGE